MANLLAQNFTATYPDEKWLVDSSYIDDEGWLYLAGVLDVFSRKIVGWSMAERMSKDLSWMPSKQPIDGAIIPNHIIWSPIVHESYP